MASLVRSSRGAADSAAHGNSADSHAVALPKRSIRHRSPSPSQAQKESEGAGASATPKLLVRVTITVLSNEAAESNVISGPAQGSNAAGNIGSFLMCSRTSSQNRSNPVSAPQVCRIPADDDTETPNDLVFIRYWGLRP